MNTPISKPESTIILASSSPYRRQLLSNLRLNFRCISPNIDETALPGETPQQLVSRLAVEKAQTVAEQAPPAIIIASDQVAELDGRILTKPITHERAIEQLTHSSGRRVSFYTSLCVLNSQNNQQLSTLERFNVHFRQLDAEQINNYLLMEKPYDCAGSFKSEGLGISLFTKLEGEDPNSLVGLPLIKLVELLGEMGVDILRP